MKKLKKLELNSKQFNQMNEEELKHILGGVYAGGGGGDCNSTSGGGCSGGCKPGCSPGCASGCSSGGK